MDLEVFIGNKGYWLIAETIIDCLSDKHLANCRLVCHQLRNYLNNGSFWKKRWIKKLENVLKHLNYVVSIGTPTQSQEEILWRKWYLTKMWNLSCCWLVLGSPVNFTAVTDPWSGDVGNALHFAARRLKNKMIDLLLEHSMDIGIDFNDKNDLGETALHIIAKRKICTPCFPNIPNIQCRVQLCLKQLLDYAVARNIGVNIKNSRGQTPFEVMLKGHACVK